MLAGNHSDAHFQLIVNSVMTHQPNYKTPREPVKSNSVLLSGHTRAVVLQGQIRAVSKDDGTKIYITQL